MLYFQRKFLEPIRRGEKTQTIRLWKTRRVRLGQLSYVPGLSPGRVRIESIEGVELESLTEADAQRDGFESLAELHAEIRRLYPSGITDGRQAWRIRFAYDETAAPTTNETRYPPPRSSRHSPKV